MQSHCSCDYVNFEFEATPLMRAYCHCTICQEFNDAPYGDITLFRSKDVNFDQHEKIDFKAYKSGSPVARGKCTACNEATIETFKMFGFPDLTIIPSANIEGIDQIIEPSMHVWYRSRVTDMNDNLPKYSGPIQSQTIFMTKLIGSLIRN